MTLEHWKDSMGLNVKARQLLSLFSKVIFFAFIAHVFGNGILGPSSCLGEVLVFPGAQGYGRYTKAGRGGEVIKVTTLKDSGPGSLREALQDTAGPRIIVFEVGGVIQLKRPLKVSHPYVTVAGQSAPPPGIHTVGYGLRINTHDVLIQHIFVRFTESEVQDAIDVHRNPVPYNIVIDHVSTSWGRDECLSFNPGSTNKTENNVTFSNNIIAESNYGTLISDGTKNLSAIGNLWISNCERQPRIKGGVVANVINNVSYNVGTSGSTVVGGPTTGPSYISLVGNIYLDGPNTVKESYGISTYDETHRSTRIYVSDGQPEKNLCSPRTKPFLVSTPPTELHGHSIFKSDKVEKMVLFNAGARPGERDGVIGNEKGDDVDERLIMEVKTRSGSIKKKAPDLSPLKESRRHFKLPEAPCGDDDGDGYTNIEELLFEMALQVEGKG